LEKEMTTIQDILGSQYPDFMAYCIASEKVYPTDISPSDYVAFRVQYGVSREYINEIKDRINKGEVCKTTAAISDAQQKAGIVQHVEEKQETEAKDSSLLIDTQKIIKPVDEIDQTASTVEEVGVDDADVGEENTKRENNKTIPYDIHAPLYVVFGVDNPEKYSNISIETMGLKPKLEQLLKEGGRKTVLDVLRCSIAQLFNFNRIARTAILNITEQIKTFVSVDLDPIEIKLKQVAVPFYTLFNVENLQQYKDVSVKSITFSVRFTNALKENKIDTLFSLLQLSIDELQKWEHLGHTSIKDAVVRLDEYFNDANKKCIKIRNYSFEEEKTREKVVALIDAEIKGEAVSCDDLGEDEFVLYSQIKESIDVCGEEFYVELRSNPVYAKNLAKGLNNFSAPILEEMKKKDNIFRCYCSIPLEFRSKSARLLYQVYKLRTCHTIAFLDSVDDQITLSELICKVGMAENVEYYQSLVYFLQWISSLNVNNIVENIFSRAALTGSNKVKEGVKDKYWVVLEMRAEGETLENIASLADSTRERIRQIEKKYTNRFAMYYQNSEYDLLALIHALRGGDNVLRKEEVQALIGEKYTNLLWLVLSKELLDCDLYRYSKEYNAVIFGADDKNNAESLRLVLRELPDMFFEDRLEELVDDLSKKYSVSTELITIDIEKQYSKYGKLYSKSAPTVIFMCQYVLKAKFPNGFKTGDDDEAKRFQAYLTETFGDIKGRMTARALNAVVGKVGVLCDRGKYIHSDYLHVEKEIIDEINAYIDASEKTVVTYSEVFDELRTVLSGSQITNRFILQGALKFYGCKYKLTKDYISKEDGRSLTDEFENFAREHGEFHKMDFFTAFPSMTDANLGMLVGRCQNVFSLDTGYYMHSSALNLIDKDYDDIRRYLDNVCADGPVNSRHLFEEFSYMFIDFMSRNEISNHTKLFGILSYMFGKEFAFSRPYVSKEENGALTNKDVVLHYLDGIDSITIENIIEMCQERGVRYMSSRYLIRHISPNFIRINETTLMRYELTGVNDDVILEVAAYIENCLKTNKYCSVATIKDFLWFPTINIEWTSYLIESIMYLSGDVIGRINIPTTSMTCLTSIYVSEEFIGDDYVTFILKILDEAFEKGFFSSKEEVRGFLFEKGLISNNILPNFLASSEYYYMDENGVLKRRK
jgi:hypothetical protein